MEKIKKYFKDHYKATLVSFTFFTILFIIDGRKNFILFFVLFLVAQVESYYGDRRVAVYKEKLKVKGLQPLDLGNITFVKSWEETRASGIWKYCLIDGGLITGAGIGFVLCLIFPAFNGIGKSFAGPGTMFVIIGYSYLIGITLGMICYRVIWPYKQRRFNRLTKFPFGIDEAGITRDNSLSNN